MNATDHAHDLLAAAPCHTVLPAGAGKTEILASCCGILAELGQRTLFLTHTNAGVEAFRRRLSKLGVDQSAVDVRTIAAWCEAWCRRYPLLAGIPPDIEPDEYDVYYAGAALLLEAEAIRRVIRSTWSVVLVDEYQDCNVPQHNAIRALSNAATTVVVGDPLQSVFNFPGQPTVGWAQDVATAFPAYVELPWEPHRWSDSNPGLGDDLVAIRERLEQHQPIDLTLFKHVSWIPHDNYTRIPTCKKVTDLEGSALVIHQTRAQAVDIARKCDGKLEALEDLRGSDLATLAVELDSAPASDRVGLVFDFAYKCIARLPGGLKDRAELIKAGGTPNYKQTSVLGPVTEAALLCRDTGSPQDLQRVARAISRFDQIVIARRELWRDLDRSLTTMIVGKTDNFGEAASTVRAETRRHRRISDGVVGTPLLVKGLEFDNVVVVAAEQLKREQLYVSLTRGRSSLTVLSATAILNPE